MATRRTATRVEVPIPPTANGSGASSPSTEPTKALDFPSATPWLPTSLELTLLAIYPLTLLLGSLFSTLHPSTRAAHYSPTSQSYDSASAPSYFARKSNVFNVYFVKIGWVWITSAFLLFVGTHSSLGPPLRPVVTRRRWQALARYVAVTLVWVGITQWFFGPPIIDRSFRWTGGKCEAIYSDTVAAQAERADMSEAERAFTHSACKMIGGQWKGGHDISGHVFLLILGSGMLWLEMLPALLRTEGLREARRIFTSDGLVRNASVETQDMGPGKNMRVPEETSIGVKAALLVAGMSWWMLLMTAAYFHTWFEKFTGLMVAFSAVYVVYFLPRALPAWRRVVGMPGV